MTDAQKLLHLISKMFANASEKSLKRNFRVFNAGLKSEKVQRKEVASKCRTSGKHQNGEELKHRDWNRNDLHF